MTNFEKYKDVVLSMIDDQCGLYGVVDGEPVPCKGTDCFKCQFHEYGVDASCAAAFIKWLCQEYEKKPVISERAYHFLKSLPEGAKIEHSEGRLYMHIGHKIVNTSRCSEFVPEIPLQPDVWYEISDLLEWEVEG